MMFSSPKIKIRNNDNANSNKTSLLMCVWQYVQLLKYNEYVPICVYSLKTIRNALWNSTISQN